MRTHATWKEWTELREIQQTRYLRWHTHPHHIEHLALGCFEQYARLQLASLAAWSRQVEVVDRVVGMEMLGLHHKVDAEFGEGGGAEEGGDQDHPQERASTVRDVEVARRNSGEPKRKRENLK